MVVVHTHYTCIIISNSMQRNTIKLQDAIARMRKLSELNVPFSFSFISYNETDQTSGGLKTVKDAQLRTGLREDQSTKHNILIAYTNLESEHPRQFYLPLLMTFNGYKIQP